MADQKKVRPEAMVEMGWISTEELDRLTAEANGEQYDDVLAYLIKTKRMTNKHMHMVWAFEHGVEYHDLEETPPQENVIALVPGAVARRYRAVPVKLDEHDSGVLHLACEDPTNLDVTDGLRGALSRYSLRLHYCRTRDIDNAIARAYSADAEASAVASSMLRNESQNGRRGGRATVGGDLGLIIDSGDNADAARIVNLIVEAGVRDGASDIHLDPQRKDALVRYRVDGVLYDASRYAFELSPQLVSRIKVIGGMDTAETRLPQAGRITTTVEGRQIDLRVSTMPVHGISETGEKVVLRILNSDASGLRLEKLGYRGEPLEDLRDSFRRSQGMVVFTGPTGSGKSTSIFAMLNEIATREVNVMTVEDPVEYRLEGINQVAVSVKEGRTFPTVIRDFLRQDPDIILVGEMRDPETAAIAMQAAQTGHLVLSTLHTTSAAGAMERMVQMGVANYLVGSVVNSVVAQRLPRLLCVHCKEPQRPTERELRRFLRAEIVEAGDINSVSEFFYGPVGCGRCKNTGYSGRVAITEVMTMTDKIEALLSDNATAFDISAAARSEGMQTLLEDGWTRLLEGVTSISEIQRVA